MKKLFIIVLILIIFVFLTIVFWKQNAKMSGYKKSEIIKLNDFINSTESLKNSKCLNRNYKGDVIYNNKVIITEDGRPINDETAAESVFLLKILLIADGAIPKENCDINDTSTNGILGCYVYEDAK